MLCNIYDTSKFNFPELAYKTVINELCANNFDENKIKVGVANRSNPSEILNLEVS